MLLTVNIDVICFSLPLTYFVLPSIISLMRGIVRGIVRGKKMDGEQADGYKRKV
jgi:hypothetical protein